MIVVLSALACVAAAPKISPDAASMVRKVKHLQANGERAHPDQRPTAFTEKEINAYLASGQVHLPKGVESVTLQGEAGAVAGTARVDFDRVREGVRSDNPLLSIFTGVHEVVVTSHAYGKGGDGYVHVDSMSLDGFEVPHFVLQIFVEKFITPKHPELGMDSRFKLPDRIDEATVGQHTLTLTQK